MGFDELTNEVLANDDARTAAKENEVRRQMGKTFLNYLHAYGWNAGQVSMHAGIPIAQARRLLREEVGGLLSLRSIVRVADLFGLDVKITLTRHVEKP